MLTKTGFVESLVSNVKVYGEQNSEFYFWNDSDYIKSVMFYASFRIYASFRRVSQEHAASFS